MSAPDLKAVVDAPDAAAAVGRLTKTSHSRVFDSENSSPGAAWTDLEDVGLKSRAAKWWRLQKERFRRQRQTYSPADWAAEFLPCVGWISTYSIKQNLLMDVLAGLSIAFMVVPQGMSYALLAGLPAVYGLYGAFVPVLVYALFGSSRHLAVGPVAVTSLLMANSLQSIFPAAKDIADPNNPGDLAGVQRQYNEAAIQVSFLVAICYLAIAALRLGFLANFLSHSVISGFTTGAAAIIGLSQLKYFFGISIPSTHTALETVIELIKHVDETKWREAVMCSVWLVWLIGLKKLSKKYPKYAWLRPLGPISVVFAAIIAVVAFDLDGKGLVRTVKTVPKGLPEPTIDQWLPLYDPGKQITTAIIVFVVGFMESISISKALARRHKYKINVTQEIAAMGFANLFGSMFSSYATTGSFSRSAVNADVGAKTNLSGVLTGFIVMLVLLFITPVFEKVPYNAMGAIVLSSVLGLFELSEALFLARNNFLDFLVWAAAFLGTIFLGVEIGLGIAIGLALLLVIYQSAFPHTAVLGRLPGARVYRNVKQYPQALQLPHICVVRVDAPIYFANVEVIRTRIDKYVARSEANPAEGPIFFVILDLSPVPFVDATGMHALMELVDSMKDCGQQLVLANPSRKVQAQLQRVHLLEAIGRDWVFVHTSDAVEVCTEVAAEKLRHTVALDLPGDMAESASAGAASDTSEDKQA